MVGGYQQWQSAGRQVTSGPGSGLNIWIPTKGKKTDKKTGEETETTRFVFGTVFDISQTEPITVEEPEIAPERVKLSGNMVAVEMASD